MRHEFSPPHTDRRFQRSADSTIVGALRKVDQMSLDSATNADEPINATEEVVRLRAADYLWHPWYAKLWWAAIPVYWLPAGGIFKIDLVTEFYSSAAAVYLNILFLPLTALVVLGFGYARAWRESAEWIEGELPQHNRSSIFYRRVGGPPAYLDPRTRDPARCMLEAPKVRQAARGVSPCVS